MDVLIDTTVWSLGLRRRRRDLNPAEVKVYFQWEYLLKQGDATLIGPIRQEVLSGIASIQEFTSLAARLDTIPDLPISQSTFVLAAEFFNLCRSHGTAAGSIDMTICAASREFDLPIFTTDPDFQFYARHLPIKLFRP
ncbi:MAG TPA: PIN domain nuclease [Phycisphaerae bacterium]|jgi:hypothetical protein